MCLYIDEHTVDLLALLTKHDKVSKSSVILSKKPKFALQTAFISAKSGVWTSQPSSQLKLHFLPDVCESPQCEWNFLKTSDMLQTTPLVLACLSDLMSHNRIFFDIFP